MNLAKQVGKRLKEARNNKKMTQKQVAELLRTVQPAYARYELGLIELDYDKLIFLCKLFDVSADFLLGLADI